MKLFRELFWCFCGLFIFAAGCSHERRNVILTGYWPPSNQMLSDFSTDKSLNPMGWKGENWRGLGYDVYAFFPTFPISPGDYPKGRGDFEVDYQDTQRDFERITRRYKPIVIICYGAGKGPWEIEQYAVFRYSWHDDYQFPSRPDVKDLQKAFAQTPVLCTTLASQEIADAVNQSGLGIFAWVDKHGDPGDFLCDYMACLAMAYQQAHGDKYRDDVCKAAGFIHVGREVPLEQAGKAQEITLEIVLRNLKKE